MSFACVEFARSVSERMVVSRLAKSELESLDGFGELRSAVMLDESVFSCLYFR